MNADLHQAEQRSSGAPVTGSPGHRVTGSSFYISREGRYWVAVAVGLLGIGLFKGINLLLMLACVMVAVWGLNLLLAGRRLDRLRGHRSIDRPVFAQTPF